jgi:proline iminopeptidase
LADGMPQPDETYRIAVPGGEVAAYSYGTGADVVFLVNGGPGIASDGIRADYAWLAERGWRVVAHDQLGTGASDCPDDPSLWTIARYGDEIEAVRQALGFGPVHLIGHSWGGWLSCDYVCRYPASVKSFIAANTGADMPLHMAELRRLIGAFGIETQTMIDRHEAAGTLDDPEYRAFCTLFYIRHSARRPTGQRPPARERALNMQVQIALWGPAEFSCTGSLRAWSRLEDLRAFDRPCLVFNGYHDYLTIKEGAEIHAAVPGSEMVVFANSGHAPMRDEPEACRAVVEDFLERHR